MSRFEDNLWRSVVDRHGEDLAAGDGPVSAGTRRARPLVAGATLGLAASATAVALLVGATASPQPAYAVTQSHNGAVSVKVNSRSGIASANRRLAALGIHQRVTDVTHGRSVTMGWSLPASGCWMYETGKPPVTVQLSAADQQADIHNGLFTPPATTGNTGGPPQNGPWHVIYCQTSRDNPNHSASTGSWALPPSGCWMNEPGKPPVSVQLSAADQQADIHNGLFTPPATTGNTGGPPQNGPWHVIYCQTDSGAGAG